MPSALGSADAECSVHFECTTCTMVPSRAPYACVEILISCNFTSARFTSPGPIPMCCLTSRLACAVHHLHQLIGVSRESHQAADAECGCVGSGLKLAHRWRMKAASYTLAWIETHIRSDLNEKAALYSRCFWTISPDHRPWASNGPLDSHALDSLHITRPRTALVYLRGWEQSCAPAMSGLLLFDLVFYSPDSCSFSILAATLRRCLRPMRHAPRGRVESARHCVSDARERWSTEW